MRTELDYTESSSHIVRCDIILHYYYYYYYKFSNYLNIILFVCFCCVFHLCPVHCPLLFVLCLP
jgi:hypothetical protein